MATDRVRNHRVTVIFDTNFILSCVKFGIDFSQVHTLIEKSHEIVIPSNVLHELNTLDLKGQDATARRIALDLIDEYPVLTLEGKVDTSILTFAENHECVVCTNDRKLRRSLRKKGIPTVFIRKRKYLEMDGVIF